MQRLFIGLAFPVLLFTSCQVLVGIKELPSRGECAAPPSDLPGAELIAQRLANGDCFYIDKYEVTRAEYEQFLQDGDPQPTSDAACAWNEDFRSQCDDASAEHPVTCVDYCDAAAFCEWAGKSLCTGRYSAPKDPQTSHWYAACSGLNGRPYPYGRVQDASRCNGADNPTTGCDRNDNCTTVSSHMLTDCATPDGVLHLSGNVDEWVAECNGSAGASDSCVTRGGSAATSVSLLQCATVSQRRRDASGRYTGFRCCVE